MNKYQKLLYKTYRNMTKAVLKNSNRKALTYSQFRVVYRCMSMLELEEHNSWVKKQLLSSQSNNIFH